MFVALFINSHLDKPLGICPDEFRFKCGAGANTKATNKTNKQISDNTNELNYKLWQEQKEYDYQKWKENNAYNTPAEQRKRYEEAGLNPNLIAQQIGSGSSESPASAGSAGMVMSTIVSHRTAAGPSDAASTAVRQNSSASHMLTMDSIGFRTASLTSRPCLSVTYLQPASGLQEYPKSRRRTQC